MNKLYIIGTPIGNLKDITLRAIETLENVDIILAEDTRNTLKLLNHFNIKKPMISYHRHNEKDKINEVVKLLDEGKNVGLVSDAGMPIISDPGQELIKYLNKHNYNVEVIPGVTAVITGLVKSSIDSTRFSFEGFLSVNKKQRRERLNELKEEVRTMVFYEAPHKIIYTLKDMYDVFGDRNICLARELTKIHEEYINDTLSNMIKRLEENPLKGEMVIVVEGFDINIKKENEVEKLKNISSKELVLNLINDGFDKKDAIKKVAKMKNINKNEVYKDCIDI